MSVYLVYRTPYNISNNKYLKKFEFNSIVDWFQYIWSFIDQDQETALQQLEDYLGIDIYGSWAWLLDRNELDEERIRLIPPLNWEELIACLENGYHNQLIADPQERFIQVLTDDDELQMAYYIFDEQAVQDFPIQSSYLLAEAEISEVFSPLTEFLPKASPQIKLESQLDLGKHLYFCYSDHSTGDNLESYVLRPIVINNCSLPYLFEYLWHSEAEQLPTPLLMLRTHLKKDLAYSLERLVKFKDYDYFSYAHNTELRDCSPPLAYERMLEQIAQYQQQQPSLKNKSWKLLSEYQYSSHFIQFSIHLEDWNSGTDRQSLFDHWVCFDDYWAREHPILAEGILQYYQSWQVFP